MCKNYNFFNYKPKYTCGKEHAKETKSWKILFVKELLQTKKNMMKISLFIEKFQPLLKSIGDYAKNDSSLYRYNLTQDHPSQKE